MIFIWLLFLYIYILLGWLLHVQSNNFVCAFESWGTRKATSPVACFTWLMAFHSWLAKLGMARSCCSSWTLACRAWCKINHAKKVRWLRWPCELCRAGLIGWSDTQGISQRPKAKKFQCMDSHFWDCTISLQFSVWSNGWDAGSWFQSTIRSDTCKRTCAISATTTGMYIHTRTKIMLGSSRS